MLTRLFMFAALVIAMTVLNPAVSLAQGVITVRLSYKIVLNPADGNRPFRGAAQVTDNDIDTAVATMNNLSAAYFRGFRFVRVGTIAEVGGLNDTTGPSRYFGIDFLNDPLAGFLKDQMETAAQSDAAYAWNNAAINIYINQGTGGGRCSFPDDGRSLIVVGATSANSGNLQLHEIGHYFNLEHTHTDTLTDTLPDRPSWNEDNIANTAFSKNYNDPALSALEKKQVDDTVLNLMSYHGTVGNQAPIYNLGQTQSQLTEQQLDRWTDAANGPRAGVCDGTTIFAQVGGGLGDGSSSNPYGFFVEHALYEAANRPGNSIVLLRPGNYVFAGGYAISAPPGTTITLRATRDGAAVINAP